MAQQAPSLPQQEAAGVAQELKEKLTMAAAPMRTMTLAILFIFKTEVVHFLEVRNSKGDPITVANLPGNAVFTSLWTTNSAVKAEILA